MTDLRLSLLSEEVTVPVVEEVPEGTDAVCTMVGMTAADSFSGSFSLFAPSSDQNLRWTCTGKGVAPKQPPPRISPGRPRGPTCWRGRSGGPRRAPGSQAT